ncbi:MAG: SPOR domain-containing protein [Dyella sp.]
MLLRLLIAMLVALNLAAAGWWWSEQRAPVHRGIDHGIPALRLLSELPAAATSTPAAAATASVTARPSAVPSSSTSASTSAGAPAVAMSAMARVPAPTAPAPRSNTCVALGPFATQADLRNVAVALRAQTTRQRTRQEQSVQSRGWWVFLPAQRNRELALAQARKLSASGINDYFVVGSGGQPNTISLGLFKDPANARKRREQVQQAGFPAQLSERTESVPVYWLDMVLAPSAKLGRSRVQLPGLTARAINCF